MQSKPVVLPGGRKMFTQAVCRKDTITPLQSVFTFHHFTSKLLLILQHIYIYSESSFSAEQ